MSESQHNHPSQGEANVREGLQRLEATLNYAESLPEGDSSLVELNQVLFTVIDGHVQNDPYYSGGHTIPGTDEWIPGERHDRYTYNTEDSKTGEKYSVSIPTAFGQRLEAFAAAQRPLMEDQQPAAESGDATVLPFKRNKSGDTQPKPADTSAEQGQSDYDPAENDRTIATGAAKLAARMKRAGFDIDAADEVDEPAAAQESDAKSSNEPKTSHGAHRAEGAADSNESTDTAHAPKHRKSKLGKTHKRDSIADLVELDASGRVRYQAGAVEYARDKNGALILDKNGEATTRGINGRFMSTYELNMIEAYQDMIRDGLADRNKTDTEPDQPVVVNPADTGLDGVIDAAEPSTAGTDTDANTGGNTTPVAPVQAARKTLRDRLMSRIKRAGKELYLLPLTLKDGAGKVVEYLNDPEKGRRRGIVAGVVGVAAVGGWVLANKYGSDLFNHAPQPHGSATGGGGVNKELVDALNGQDGGGATGTGAGETVRAHLTLQRGDSIWSDISQTAARNGHHLSDEQIQHLTQQTLNANGLSWEEARHLPVGYRFEIPEEVRAQLLSGKVA